MSGSRGATWRLHQFEAVVASSLAFAKTSNEEEMRVLAEVKESVKNDRAAWTITAALMLTMCVPASMYGTSSQNPDNEYNQEVGYIYVAALSTCAASSLLCITIATNQFLKVNLLPPHLLPEWLKDVDARHARSLFYRTLTTNNAANLALVSLAVLVVSAVYLFLSLDYVYICAPIISMAVLLGILVQHLEQQMYERVLLSETDRIGFSQRAPAAAGGPSTPLLGTGA